MKKHTIISIILLVCGCSPKISEYFEENKYIRNYSIHIVNDSLQLYFKSPADITYTADKKELKKIISKSNLKLDDDVLIYGKTDEPPYEYFVTVSKKQNQNYPKSIIVFDTLIDNQTIKFIGNPISKRSNRTLEVDLKNMLKSLEIGKSYRKEIITIMDVVKKYQNSSKYFAIFNEIKKFPTYDKKEEWAKRQMELTYSSFLGNNEFYETYLNKLESRFKPNHAISKTIKDHVITDSEVVDTIIKEAEKHKIVMINENHFYPNQRLLIFDLLEKLKKIGYSYLALEALDIKQDSLLNLKNSYPTLKTGFYTREQNYSNLIRKAKQLGYEFIAYENTDENKNRELAQAENLYINTFKFHPNRKVLVLAGIDHILEKPTDRGKEWMATIFKNKYNIDPLTISQTHLNSYRNQIESNYGIINSNFFDNERLTSVDYLILNNKPNNETENQSTYLYRNNTKTDIQVALFYGNEIRNKYDYLKKVPYFTTIINAGKKIDLPIDGKQETYLYTFDKNGKRLDKQTISPVNNGYH
ncbi:hypothetical protein [Winogradskyella alexanderae]|uniref:Uncharacterized protein n=1 Tax=Winogradskyella alexanderae TaxID=2877123 RepID=A0ABS7XRX8_9FLAO|nr:hypothetical protein [Winogradskyella alexanderae]MCA0131707.1 hypothetical protein [Winogradskyella alexanderae]